MEINIKMESKNLFEFTLLLLFIGFINVAFNYYFCKNVHLWSIIFGFLPFIIVMLRNNKAQKCGVSKFSVVSPFIVGVFIAIIVFNLLFTKIYDRAGVNSNVNSYEKYLELDNYSSNKYIGHFPSVIPSNAKEPNVLEWTGFVPRQLGFYLWYNVDKEELNNMDVSSYKESSKEIINTVYKLNEIKNVICIPDRVISELKIEDKKDFTIFLFDGSSKDEISKGYSYGIAINYTDRKIMYFSERW